MAPRSRAQLTRAERRRVEAAIAEAERGHRGEIQVRLEPRYEGDGAQATAQARFVELGLEDTRDGTGVLLYVATEDRKAAVWAGPGVHGAAEAGFWQRAVNAVSAGFARGDRAGGLVEAIAAIGEVLRTAAPGEDAAGDELPNRVSEG